MSGQGTLHVSAAVLGGMLGVPAGSKVLHVERVGWDDVEFLIEGDWLPESPSLSDIEVTYTVDYVKGVCRGRFTADDVAVYGPDIPIPPYPAERSERERR